MPEDIPATVPAGGGPKVIDMGEWLDDWDGQTVTIKPYLSYAADRRIESARVQMQAEIKAGRDRSARDVTMTSEATPMDYAVAVVEECVLEWSLIGHDGKPLPCNRAGLVSESAPAELLDVVIDEVVGYYESRRPKLKKS